MSKKEDENFAAWLDEVVAEYPAEKRDEVKALLNSDVARERFYRGTIRQGDYYRRLNEIEEARQELEGARQELYDWYETEAPKQDALIKERDMLKAQLTEGKNAGDPPPAAGVPGLSTEDLAQLKASADMVQTLNKLIPAVLADTMKIAQDAVTNKYDYDPYEVMRLSLQHGVEPYKAYEAATADQRKKRYEEEQEKQKNKWIEEGRRQAITARNGSPDQLPSSGPNVVDLLKKTDVKELTQQDRVNAALAAMLDEQGSGLG